MMKKRLAPDNMVGDQKVSKWKVSMKGKYER